MDKRKLEEIEFHETRRTYEQADPNYLKRYPNLKLYSIVRKTTNFRREWLGQRCQNKRSLVYGCGMGADTFDLARANSKVVGIDLSTLSLGIARQRAVKEGVDRNSAFCAMDCESLGFPDNCFDIVVAAGVLHHLDLPKAYSEIARVLKPNGSALCVEPLRNNPIIHLYRRLTPHLRTAWEARHILDLKQVKSAHRYFGKLDIRHHHLFTLAAVPFRTRRIFNPLLSFLEAIDSVALRIPFIRTQAWQVIFILSEPRKDGHRESASTD
jgi:ubiquinone/menaquinone biosynthesis C-methylase UbiE